MKRNLIAICMIVLFILSFSTNQLNLVESNIERDYWPTDGWENSSFEEVAMNKERIVEMFKYIDKNNFAIDSVLIVKDGDLVVEEYLTISSETLHPIYSVTKSFTSTLIGIAIEEGYIESVDQKIIDFIGHVDVPNIDSKENITIAHLLTMTSGIVWNEDISYHDPENTFRQLYDSSNWVEFVLNQAMEDEPGNTWKYNSGGSHLLSAIIENATGISTLGYADSHIFSTLGFSNYYWEEDPQNICFGGSGLQLLPRDMAKLGYLFLNNGTWDETQIVPEEWVSQASEGKIYLSERTDYGYQWWIFPLLDAYLALGWAGQIICVIPQHDIVAVFTSSLDESEFPFRELLADYIIKASEEGYIEPIPITMSSIILSLSISTAVIMFKKKQARLK
ncbi:MAG: serine hydrolase [Candidatus Heimdallarchaeota archaeon]|nr:serine hydrolase [Candidatus Heimdallarchaeota archaeon]